MRNSVSDGERKQNRKREKESSGAENKFIHASQRVCVAMTETQWTELKIVNHAK